MWRTFTFESIENEDATLVETEDSQQRHKTQ